MRGALADHPDEQTISLLAISVSNLEDHSALQLEFPLGLADEARRPGAKKGMARLVVRPRYRQGPRSIRMGSHWLRLGRVGSFPLGA